MHKFLGGLLLIMLVVSCSFFKEDEEQVPVAKLGNYALFEEDIQALLPVDYTAADSAAIVSSYLDQWATDRLLLRNALDNIPEDRQLELDQLIEAYKVELYAQEYLKEMVKQHMDTSVSEQDIAAYYEQRREDLKLNEDLVQFQYIHLDPLNKNLNDIYKWFKKGDSLSMRKLDSLNLSYRSYFLNDSIWVKKSTVFDRISVITPSNEDTYLKEGQNWKLEDSLGVYLMRFKNILTRGNRAPLSYVKPTIKQVLLNKSKISYIQKLEKDLLNDAKSNDKLKISK